VEEVHNGYFSIDRKGGWTDTSEGNQGSRDNAERAYNLIMKDKERLLSFETPLKFIFSHSALKEGWDNPNVFQICTLRDMQTEQARRQTIGRGLRLMTQVSPDRTQTLEVLGTRNLLNVLRNQLEAEGVGVASTKPDPPLPVSIYPVRERLAGMRVGLVCSGGNISPRQLSEILG